eukprot:CAMPEP_0117677456 /NCGR_PEP_ID=MMETSP0804-20121206/16756_1 /TAXON_ID=1074897 /ORGANISM="Tetraselmis astigmatica, Strain CCMP880" /LENGTH=242 /DNA_ID=CAMNT_0005486743 /DNA_START=453 /DNA_END=1181 /DNA_ORIENTATION=+
MSGLPAAHLAVLLATLLSAGMMGKLTAAMELVKPTLMIPKDSYEEFLIRGPVTVSYVVNVINGTKIDAVFLDKANFIRFANKRDAEFVEEASDLDAQTAHILHYQLDAGIHYLVIDNTKEFGQTKPSGDVTVFLAINVISAGQMGSRFGEIVVPTWVAAAGLAAVLCALGAASICGCLLLLRHPAPPRDEHEESDPELMLVRRSRSTGRGSPLKSKVGLKRSSLVGKKLAGLYSQPEKERTA